MKSFFILFFFLFSFSILSADNNTNHSCINCNEQTNVITKGEIFCEIFAEVKEMLDLIIVSEDTTRSEKDILREVMKSKIKLLENIMDMAKWEKGGFNGPSGSVTCALCNGSGIYKGKLCTACKADGSAWSNDDPGHEVKCGLCKGTGLWTPPSGTGTPDICPGCNGTGWANSAPNGPISKEQLKSVVGRTKQ